MKTIGMKERPKCKCGGQAIIQSAFSNEFQCYKCMKKDYKSNGVVHG